MITTNYHVLFRSHELPSSECLETTEDRDRPDESETVHSIAKRKRVQLFNGMYVVMMNCSFY